MSSSTTTLQAEIGIRGPSLVLTDTPLPSSRYLFSFPVICPCPPHPMMRIANTIESSSDVLPIVDRTMSSTGLFRQFTEGHVVVDLDSPFQLSFLFFLHSPYFISGFPLCRLPSSVLVLRNHLCMKARYATRLKHQKAKTSKNKSPISLPSTPLVKSHPDLILSLCTNRTKQPTFHSALMPPRRMALTTTPRNPIPWYNPP